MKFRTVIIGLLTFSVGLLFSTLSLAQSLGNQEWPVEINSKKGKIVIYEPQPETFQRNKLTGRAAVSLTPIAGKNPEFGAIWFSAILSTDSDQRTYELKSIDVTKVKFPNSTPEQESEFSQAVETELPKRNLHGSLDSLLSLLETVEKEEKASANLQNSPPEIIFVKYPAVLVLIDGDAQLEAIEGSSLMRVVNTPMLMVFDPGLNTYYLSSGSAWYSAPSALGPWQVDRNPPAQVNAIVTEDGRPVANNIPDNMMPKIIVSTVPAELIVSQGEPKYSPIQGTSLIFMSNTENQVLMDINSQYYYILLSGRWYKSKSLQGPWTYMAADKLPADFAKIPSASEKGDVLVSVPGTEQAQDALIQAQVPQTAEVRRSEAQLTVVYDGPPEFERIRDTNMEYAVNTSTPVLLINGRYYACDNAVWFVAPTPHGPWTAADSIPREIQTIPPDCPVYNVKYVYIYDSTPEVIYVGYTPGYIGWYPYYDTVVYGTGYRYPCWRRNHYYPRQWTFGFMPRFYYYPVIGWGYGYSWGYGFMTIGWNWNYDWRCNGWYGPGNYHGYYPRVYNPRRDFTQYKTVNMYRNANIGNQVSVGKKSYKIDRNNPRNIYSRKDNVNRVAFTPQTKVNLTRASVSQGKPNNVLIDKDGNAFRNNKNGWQKNTGKVWSQATPEAKGVVGSQGTSQPGGKIQTYGRAQTQSQPQTQTQTQTQSRTQTQTQPQSQTQTRTPSYGQSQSQSLSQTKSSKPVVPEHVQNEYQARQRGDERAYQSAPSSGSSQGSQPKSETPKYSGGESSGSQRSNDTPRSSGGSSSGSQGSYGTSRSSGSSSGGSRSSGSSGRSQSSSGRHR